MSPCSLQNCFTDNPLRFCAASRSRHWFASGDRPLLADGFGHETTMQPGPAFGKRGSSDAYRILQSESA